MPAPLDPTLQAAATPWQFAAERPSPREGMLYRISLAGVLFGFWLLLSGHYTTLLIAAGAGSVAASLALSQRMGLLDREGHPVHLGIRLPVYWTWLAWEMAKSAWDVARLILRGPGSISPTLIRIRPTQASELGKVIFANSITLTPGTITLKLDDEGLLVHALTREAADGLAAGDMDRHVARLEQVS